MLYITVYQNKYEKDIFYVILFVKSRDTSLPLPLDALIGAQLSPYSKRKM